LLGTHTNGSLSRDHGIAMELGWNFSGIPAGVGTLCEYLHCRLQRKLFEYFALLNRG